MEWKGMEWKGMEFNGNVDFADILMVRVFSDSTSDSPLLARERDGLGFSTFARAVSG
jgi:hypothetical protein